MEYLKKCFIQKNEKFNWKALLSSLELESIQEAEVEVTRLLHNISNFKPDQSRKDLIEFALDNIQNNFKVFNSKEVKNYYLQLDKENVVTELETANIKQALKYAKTLSHLSGTKRKEEFDGETNPNARKKYAQGQADLRYYDTNDESNKDQDDSEDYLSDELYDIQSDSEEDNEDFINATITTNEVHDTITVKLNDWIKASSHIDNLEKQDLLRYSVVDLVENSSSSVHDILSKEEIAFFCKDDKRDMGYDVNEEVIKEKINPIIMACKNLRSLQQSIKEKYEHIHDANVANDDVIIALKILQVYSHQQIHNLNRLIAKNQTEFDYTIHFVSPLVLTLFNEGYDTDVKWGDTVLEAHQYIRNKDSVDSVRRRVGHRIDGKVNLVDDDREFITNFSLVEVSGPPQTISHSHYLRDKIKIAKGLRFILDVIYLKYPSPISLFKKLFLIGIQFYNNKIHVYEMKLVQPGFYYFCLKKIIEYPITSISLKPRMIPFIIEILKLKHLIESSKENIFEYIENHDHNYLYDSKIVHANNVSPCKRH